MPCVWEDVARGSRSSVLLGLGVVDILLVVWDVPVGGVIWGPLEGTWVSKFDVLDGAAVAVESEVVGRNDAESEGAMLVVLGLVSDIELDTLQCERGKSD